jgi:hypothetical protein
MMREVGGVGRYFGMQNATAAQAIGGLRTGRMGAQLYQFGINTTDPNTGQPLSTEAIAQQLYGRMTMGGRVDPTAEQMATNLRAGFGSVDMQMFSPEQRAILEPMLINMAAGKPLGDLATLPFNADNPLNAQMKLATSMTSLMERGTEPMIAGFESAANAAAALFQELLEQQAHCWLQKVLEVHLPLLQHAQVQQQWAEPQRLEAIQLFLGLPLLLLQGLDYQRLQNAYLFLVGLYQVLLVKDF